MKKAERHQLITRLLNERPIKKQEEFVEILGSRGITVTQATISRDIKELKLIKVPATTGGYRYSLPAQTEDDLLDKLNNLLSEAFVSVNQMEKFISLKTLPGNAAASANLIERAFDLFAVLNDDDSVLMIAKTQEDAIAVAYQLRKSQG